MSMATPLRSKRRQKMTADVHMHRLLRRYEPLVIAFAVVFTIIELVSPLHVGRFRAPGLTPFAAPKVPAPAEPTADASTGSGGALATTDTTALTSTVSPSTISNPRVTSPSTRAGMSRAVSGNTTATTTADATNAEALAAPGSAVAVWARPPAPAAGGVAVAPNGSVYATL